MKTNNTFDPLYTNCRKCKRKDVAAAAIIKELRFLHSMNNDEYTFDVDKLIERVVKEALIEYDSDVKNMSIGDYVWGKEKK